jgi:hypothetical protein
VLVVDVGPHMAEHLVHLRKGLFLLAESKVRVGVVCGLVRRTRPLLLHRTRTSLACAALSLVPTAAAALNIPRDRHRALRHHRWVWCVREWWPARRHNLARAVSH